MPAKRFSFLCATILTLFLIPALISAQETTAWAPPEPSPNSFDWVKLVSGEWLGGEIKVMRDQDLSFDSDKLDDLVLEMEDVTEIRSPRILTYAFSEKRVATGTAVMNADTVIVRNASGDWRFARRDLESIVPGASSEWDHWDGTLSLGLVQRVGNTDQTDFSALFRSRRETARTQVRLSYTGNLSQVEGDENVNNHRGDVAFSYFLNKNLFITPISVAAYADKFQNIRLQWSLGSGVGWYLVRKSDLEFLAALGGGYQVTRYRSVTPGEQLQTESAVAFGRTALDWDITGDIEFTFDYSVTVPIPESQETVHHTDVLLSIDLVSDIDLDFSTAWDHVQSPQADSNGNVPKSDDVRLSIGLGIDF